MAALIWDNDTQSFKQAATPLVYDSAAQQWVKTTGLAWDKDSQQWVEVWNNNLITPELVPYFTGSGAFVKYVEAADMWSNRPGIRVQGATGGSGSYKLTLPVGNYTKITLIGVSACYTNNSIFGGTLSNYIYLDNNQVYMHSIPASYGHTQLKDVNLTFDVASNITHTLTFNMYNGIGNWSNWFELFELYLD